MRRTALPLLLILSSAGLFGCAEGINGDADRSNDEAWVAEYGSYEPIDTAAPLGKPDTVNGPRTSWEQSDAVWVVTHAWSDIDPETGMNYEELYRDWVGSLPTTARHAGGTTFQITTPYGITMDAPVLECAEVAIFLRASFASWHGLPFYLTASSNGQRIYLGHFGFRNADGSRFRNTPSFRSRYQDYTSSWHSGSAFPSDSALRTLGLYGGGDEVPFLPDVNGEPARAGAYFDALFLNKRVGHFMLLALTWFGSMNLADSSNMMHIKPEATQAGDVLLHRWQRSGIGHTIPVMRARRPIESRLDVSVATGSMPRRQPVWESGAQARWYFTSEDSGGEGENIDGDAYAAMGGGIRRWRTPRRNGSIYVGGPLAGEESDQISASDIATIAARPARFAQILQEVSPADMRDAALAYMAAARTHLTNYPASCAARERREAGWQTLVEVMQAHFGMSEAEVASRYRTLADYVFRELIYSRARTCCWNSSTNDMYEIIMRFANAEQEEAIANNECREPTVFMARNVGAGGSDGYKLYADYAASIGLGAEWRAWSRDESCPWQNETNDQVPELHGSLFCDLEAVADEPPAPCADGNDTRETATPIGSQAVSGRICHETEVDYYAFDVPSTQAVRVDLLFSHAAGDLDLLVESSAGAQVGVSQSTSDNERVNVTLSAGRYLIRVYGWSGAMGDYTLRVERTDSSPGGGSSTNCGDTGASAGTATALNSSRDGLRICAQESDWWRYTAPTSGTLSVTTHFDHSQGDLDLALHSVSGSRIGLSQGVSNSETVSVPVSAGEVVIIQVYGYGGATGDYRLAIGG